MTSRRNGINEAYITGDQEYLHFWYIIPADRPHDRSEMLALLEHFFDTWDGVFTPQPQHGELKLPTGPENTRERVPIETDSASSTDIEQVVTATQDQYDGDTPLFGIIIRGAADVYLKQGFVRAAPDSPEVYRLIKRGRVYESSPSWPPLSILIYKIESDVYRSLDVDAEWIYEIGIATCSDIWFAESDLGRINRARFHQALTVCREEWDILDQRFSNDLMHAYPYLVEEIAETPYDGHPPEDLIEKYRREWVETELVGSTSIKQDGNHRVFEFAPEETDVFDEELRARIEAYVEARLADGDAPNADRVRVVRASGTVLEATLTDDGLQWLDA